MSDQKSRVKELEALVTKQARLIDDMRAARVPKLPRATALKRRGGFVRVVIPDTHGSSVDPAAFAAALADIETLRPREVVWLGDHLDCGGFLAQHHTAHYVAQTEYTFADDCAAANDHLDRVCKAAPGAAHHYIEGNHERRLETFVCTATLRNAKDAEFLRSMFSAPVVLGLAKRGIPYYGMARQHFGLQANGAIKLGHCHFVHGISTAKSATVPTLSAFGGSVVFGHTHRSEGRAIEPVASGTIAAWSPGCLCQKIPMYAHTNPTNWTHGFAVQFVADDGTFLHLQIPIIGGVSYLRNFLQLVKL